MVPPPRDVWMRLGANPSRIRCPQRDGRSGPVLGTVTKFERKRRARGVPSGKRCDLEPGPAERSRAQSAANPPLPAPTLVCASDPLHVRRCRTPPSIFWCALCGALATIYSGRALVMSDPACKAFHRHGHRSLPAAVPHAAGATASTLCRCVCYRKRAEEKTWPLCPCLFLPRETLLLPKLPACALSDCSSRRPSESRENPTSEPSKSWPPATFCPAPWSCMQPADSHH